MHNPKELADLARFLADWGHERKWIGTDPYDGLAATRVPAFVKRQPIGRKVLIQAVKRSPVNVRPLLGVPVSDDPAALSWVASAYAIGGFLEPAEEEARLRAIIERLLELRSSRFEEPSWGYHWAFESRIFRQPAWSPCTIPTAYVGVALIDAYERLGDRELLTLAEGVGRYFLRHVPQHEDRGGAYFAYWPSDQSEIHTRTPVHNANLHVCGLLAKLSMHTAGDPEEFAGPARLGVGYALAHQRSDGAWPYGERSNLAWVDNFHTGYVLDSLRFCRDAGLDPRLDEAIARGLDYYARHLFLADGTPKYYDDNIYPIDSQCYAQAIQTLAIAADDDPRYLELGHRVLTWTLANMRRRDGAFKFQRRRFWVNPAAHVRGTMASMLLGMAYLLRATDSAEDTTAAVSAAAAGG
jgi:hypothetical protein